MDAYLPNSAFLNNIDGNFLKKINLKDTNSLHITAHEKWLSVHPLVIAMIGALGYPLRDGGTIDCEPLQARSAHYFQRIGLFPLLNVPADKDITEHESAGRFIPLTRITNSKELSSFLADVVPLMHLSVQQTEPLKYVLSELIRNVLEHAFSEDGAFVCSQYYKDSNILRIGVVDRGVGLRKALEQSYAVDDDVHAVTLALTPGITGTSKRIGGSEYNAGAGLFFTKSLAKMSRSFFVIYSGNAFYKLHRTSAKIKQPRLYADPLLDKHSLRTDLPYWQGTAVGIDLSLDQNQPFIDFLGLLRTEFKKAVQQRKEQQYKKVRFT